MLVKGYTILTKEEFSESYRKGEDIVIFSNLETLRDVYGEYVDYHEIDYENDDYDLLTEN